MRLDSNLFLLFVTLTILSPASAWADEAHSVLAATNHLQVREGYAVQAIASEPLIADPVSAKFDYSGRLWVVEMPDYPLGAPDGSGPNGRIKILRDTDGDGLMDQATVFADGLSFATGVQPYRDGAFITESDRILFLSDTDGDSVADNSEVLFKGFATGNQQLRANHPTLGPDGMIYVASGLRGGKIMAVSDRYEKRDEPIDLRDRDFCFDPEGTKWFTVAGKSQFGQSIDDFGRRVGCSNRNPSIVAPLTLAAIDRDPLLVPRDALHDIGAAGEKSIVKPIGKAWTTSNLHSGQFSAACGVCASGLFEHDREFILTCEPTSYLVQRQFVSEFGSVWKSEREAIESEFLASSDTWFRPVDAIAGPDDSIIIVDMARAVIEHPDFMPVELKKREDLRDGIELGRIWRVSKKRDALQPQQLTNPTQAIKWLESNNPWQREMASHYLLQHKSSDTTNRLHALVRDGQHKPAAVARAAQALHRFDELTDIDCRSMLASKHPYVQAMGVRLSRYRSSVRPFSLKLATSENAMVRREVAATAVESASTDQAALQALTAILNVVETDQWISQTILSAPESMIPSISQIVVKQAGNNNNLIGHSLERMSIRDPVQAASMVTQSISDGDANTLSLRSIAALSAWTRGVKRRRVSIQAAMDKLDPETREKLSSMTKRCLVTALMKDADLETRVQCIDLVGKFGLPDPRLRDLLSSNQPPALRIASFGVLLQLDRDWTRGFFLTELGSMTARLRSQAVQSMASSTANATWLLQQIENGQVKKQVVDPATSKRLSKHPNKVISGLARELFKANASRAAVIAKYSVAAKNLGDPRRGKKLFAEHCSACHRIDSVGTNVGPDISDSRVKTPDFLLAAILDPNAAIDAAFVQYTALTQDGQIVDGLLINETADSITLAQKGGKQTTLNRDEIERFQSPGVSLMPEGFEQNVSVDAMSDLLAYLKSWRYLSTEIPGAIDALQSGK